MKKIALMLLLVIMACATPGWGTGRFQLSPQAGIGFKEFNSTLGVGIASSFELFHRFFLETEFFWNPRTDSWHSDWQKGHEEFVTASFSFLYEFGSSARWAPFVFAGAALMREYYTSWDYVPGWIDQHSHFRDDLFNFDAGAGFKVWLKPRFGLRFEACAYLRPSMEEYHDILNRWRLSGGVVWKL